MYLAVPLCLCRGIRFGAEDMERVHQILRDDEANDVLLQILLDDKANDALLQAKHADETNNAGYQQFQGPLSDSSVSLLYRFTPNPLPYC